MRDFWKRIFDISLSVVGLLLVWWLILICWLVASLDTGANGMFSQTRVGRKGRRFRIYKIRTMYVDKKGDRSTVTVAGTAAISKSGRWMRRYKLDELPQLVNVLLGEMSFVGPRPDVPGYADRLTGDARLLLEMRPGITGPASIKYRNEENILKGVSDPEKYNSEVIWPDKVAVNLEYYRSYGVLLDLKYIFQTIFH